MNNTIEQAAPGIWLITFDSPELMDAANSKHLVPPLIEGSKEGPIVLLGALPSNPKIIAPSLVPFWLDAFVLKGIKVRAIGLATTSTSMRVMLNGVELAMRIQNRPIKTVTKPTVHELLTWATNL